MTKKHPESFYDDKTGSKKDCFHVHYEENNSVTIIEKCEMDHNCQKKCFKEKHVTGTNEALASRQHSTTMPPNSIHKGSVHSTTPIWQPAPMILMPVQACDGYYMPLYSAMGYFQTAPLNHQTGQFGGNNCTECFGPQEIKRGIDGNEYEEDKSRLRHRDHNVSRYRIGCEHGPNRSNERNDSQERGQPKERDDCEKNRGRKRVRDESNEKDDRQERKSIVTCDSDSREEIPKNNHMVQGTDGGEKCAKEKNTVKVELPKKPRTAYMIFKEEFKKMDNYKTISSEASERWQRMNTPEKIKYYNMQYVEKIDYETKLDKLKAIMPIIDVKDSPDENSDEEYDDEAPPIDFV